MKILIVKTSSLGDIIHAFPVIDYLKYHFPDAQIDWVVEAPFRELVESHPMIQQAIVIRSKEWRSAPFSKKTFIEFKLFKNELRQTSYDYLIDLQGNSKSALVTALARAKSKIGFGLASVPEWPNLLATNKKVNPPKGKNIRDDYLYLAQVGFEKDSDYIPSEFLLRLSADDTEKLSNLLISLQTIPEHKVLVCPGSNWPNKQLSEQILVEFLEDYSKKKKSHFFFIWGNASEKKIAECIQEKLPCSVSIFDKMSLPLLQNLMSKMDLVLAMDSLPLHLAGLTKTATYSFFGPSSGEKYAPKGHSFFQGNCPYGVTFDKRCPKLRSCPTGACLKSVNSLLK